MLVVFAAVLISIAAAAAARWLLLDADKLAASLLFTAEAADVVPDVLEISVCDELRATSKINITARRINTPT